MSKRRRVRKPELRDLGTPELRAKRLAAVVNIRTGIAGDQTMASSALGQLCEQGWLHPDYSMSRRMYDAGMMFLQLWRAVYPQKVGSTLGQFMPSGTAELDSSEVAEKDLKSLSEYLASRQLLDVIVNVCVYDRIPIDDLGPTKNLEKLRTALMRAMEWQRSVKRLAL